MRFNNIMTLFAILGSALVLCACASKEAENVPPPQASDNMEISVDFREIHRCSRISPEITVAYAPKGTKFYDVRLVEGSEMDRFLGGGIWNEDGSGVIPEGALTRHYTGPCPPKDREVEYSYIVSAMDTQNGQPLAVRIYRFKPE